MFLAQSNFSVPDSDSENDTGHANGAVYHNNHNDDEEDDSESDKKGKFNSQKHRNSKKRKKIRPELIEHTQQTRRKTKK